MPRIRSVEEILTLRELNDTPDKMARKYLVKRVNELIRNGAKEQLDSVTFEVPCIIVFRPRYDRDVLTRALCKHYKRIGFGCQVEEYTLTLSWGGTSDDEASNASDAACSAADVESTPSDAGHSEEEDEPLALKFSLEGARPSMAKRVAEMKTKKA